ncbi:extracellular solute-binding protein family 1 [Pseudarthrobacter chlorophenolicus A6]|uniref:Extracellular solute-binding protein family 1 n=1 Tax=Pseudarthrobacter chlorophenolicus (strain ATCC 700700 / DSM 12829 / CIP 107037 / JCM 12360 / KCTC 9906 / NCIMB 13794 / A6) TaxID=452863 RepID=B8HFB2_PSECP|nr:extracellular solute-binding protein [Pseudarthrobacter chlorophenolicus]ACL41080.1 extracellular solute-binding protein family 1 [Pseudarthrobacter chlorophenolicus A6]SDQ70244.1 carbohydrate ABC transporter substrate-binding protein, CUT1 family [Pseudarthrobacter chlorophenolicus]
MMFRARKSLLPIAAAAAAVLALTLTGCGGAPQASDGPVTLRFSWWGSDTRHKMTEKLIEAFEAENPNIKVQGEYGDWSGYWDKLATQVASQDAPDIIQMDAAYLGEYAGRGALLELKDVDLSKFDQPVADSGKVEGKQYAVTSGVNAMVVMANPALVAASGVSLPDDKTWTWDQLDSTAAAITQASGGKVYGTGQVNSDAAANLWFRQHGKSLFTNDGKLGFEESDLAEWYEYQAKMRDSKAVPPASVITEDATASIDQQGLSTGKFAMNMYWSNQLGALSKASGQDLEIRRPPSVDGNAADAQQFYKSSMFWSASSRTKHPAEAQKFIDFVTNNAKAGEIGLADRGIPANSDIRAAVVSKLTPADAKTAKFIDEISGELGGAVPVPPAGGSAAVEALTRYSLEVHFNRLSPQEAAKKALEEAKSAIL